jgi:uncharacterized protein (DUF58 family)
MLSLGLGALLLPRQVFADSDPRPIVGVALVFIFLSEAVLVRRRDQFIEASATMAPIVQVGQDTPITVIASGESVGLVRVRHFSTAPLDGAGRATLVWTPKRRGIFRLRDVRICIGGPFGLLERTKELAPNGHGVIVVGPSRHHLPEEHVPPVFSRPADDEELHGIRLYVPGDDVRSIHWRLSAREGRPMVTTSFTPLKLATVAVDLGPVEGPKAERWAQIAATFLDRTLRDGPLAVVLRDSHGIAKVSVASTDEVNAALATAQPGEPVPLADVSAYVGVWRNDLAKATADGVLVLSEDRVPAEPIPDEGRANPFGRQLDAADNPTHPENSMRAEYIPPKNTAPSGDAHAR